MVDARSHHLRRFHRSLRSASTTDQQIAPDVAENLRFIRDTMERSAAFTAVSGWGHMLMGITAIPAALLASRQVTSFAWLRVWLAEGMLAIATGLLPWASRGKPAGLPPFL